MSVSDESPVFSVTIVASDAAGPRAVRWARLLDADILSSQIGIWALRGALRRQRPDIVQVIGVPAEPLVAVAATLSGCSAVLSVAGDEQHDRFQRGVHRRFHRYVAESQGQARAFLRHNPHVHLGRVVVVSRPLGDSGEADAQEREALNTIYRETVAMRTGRR